MTTQIQIEITHGASFVSGEDIEQAKDAALKVLADAGVTVAKAFEAYKIQWLADVNRDDMTGDALAWIAAEDAANFALTEGWSNTDGAGCGIIA